MKYKKEKGLLLLSASLALAGCGQAPSAKEIEPAPQNAQKIVAAMQKQPTVQAKIQVPAKTSIRLFSQDYASVTENSKLVVLWTNDKQYVYNQAKNCFKVSNALAPAVSSLWSAYVPAEGTGLTYDNKDNMYQWSLGQGAAKVSGSFVFEDGKITTAMLASQGTNNSAAFTYPTSFEKIKAPKNLCS